MVLWTMGAAKAAVVEYQKFHSGGGYDPLSIFAAVNSITPEVVSAGAANANATLDYQQAQANWIAQNINANTDYREAMASYNTKKDLLASELNYAQYQQTQLDPTYARQSKYADQLLINSQEQLQLIKSLPDPSAKYGLAQEKYDATVSFSQQLLDNLDDQFNTQSQLLDRKYTKDDGRAQVQFNASGFGGIGMIQAISSDIQAQKRLEDNLAYANKEAEAIQKRYNITSAGIDLKAAGLQYQSDVVDQKSKELSAQGNVLDREYNLDTLTSQYENAKVEASKKISDIETQQKYLLAPTKRQLGAAPAERYVAVAPHGSGVQSLEANGSGFSSQTIGD